MTIINLQRVLFRLPFTDKKRQCYNLNLVQNDI